MLSRIKEALHSSSQKSELNRLIADCDELVKEPGQSVSVGTAARAIDRYRQLDSHTRIQFYAALATRYDPNLDDIAKALETCKENRSPENLIQLVRAAEPPRQELLRRLNRVAHGTSVIVRMREEILKNSKATPALSAVDADFEHLLSSWFNPGFLELKRLDWTTPAHLLEKVIQHEAVHEIDGWADLRRRLEPDRRLYAYFHPVLPDEPLIFVEVALLEDMPVAIAPLLDRSRPPDIDTKHFKVAAFYSISNCQPGLKGIHLGNFLIKRVAEKLKEEFPKLKTFCTLSPIPSLVRFLTVGPKWKPGRFTPKIMSQLESDWKELRPVMQRLSTTDEWLSNSGHERLTRLCAAYLLQTAPDELAPSDPVAKFHLNNGAVLDKLNVGADLSPKGIRQSLGMMENYRYDLDKVEHHHENFSGGIIGTSKRIRDLLRA